MSGFNGCMSPLADGLILCHSGGGSMRFHHWIGSIILLLALGGMAAGQQIFPIKRDSDQDGLPDRCDQCPKVSYSPGFDGADCRPMDLNPLNDPHPECRARERAGYLGNLGNALLWIDRSEKASAALRESTTLSEELFVADPGNVFDKRQLAMARYRRGVLWDVQGHSDEASLIGVNSFNPWAKGRR